MLTPDLHGTSASAICRELPDSQTKAEQKLFPRNPLFRNNFQGKQLPGDQGKKLSQHGKECTVAIFVLLAGIFCLGI
jgi:hypothetical protein